MKNIVEVKNPDTNAQLVNSMSELSEVSEIVSAMSSVALTADADIATIKTNSKDTIILVFMLSSH